MGNTKWVHLLFAASGLLLALLVFKATEWIWGYFAKPKDLYLLPIAIVVATGVTLYFWRSRETFSKAQDIIMELMKVTWPTRKETSQATVVVIITVIIFSIFLGMFDMVWSWATDAIYSTS